MNRREFVQGSLAGTAGLMALQALETQAATARFGPLPGPLAEQPFRQVHLNFHTSRLIEGVGSAFDPDVFADTLKRAHVNSINCFGRGHHGFIYYDTKKFPERKHPHLARPILNEQIEACHKRGIRVPIYITIQWDYYSARTQPEWLQRTPGPPLRRRQDSRVGRPYRSS